MEKVNWSPVLNSSSPISCQMCSWKDSGVSFTVFGWWNFLSPFTTDMAIQLDVLWHYGHMLPVDGAQVGVLKHVHKVSLTAFLEGIHSWGLNVEISLKVKHDLMDQSLERELANGEFCALLIMADFTESDGSRVVLVRLLDTPVAGTVKAVLLWEALVASCLQGSFLPSLPEPHPLDPPGCWNLPSFWSGFASFFLSLASLSPSALWSHAAWSASPGFSWGPAYQRWASQTCLMLCLQSQESCSGWSNFAW